MMRWQCKADLENNSGEIKMKTLETARLRNKIDELMKGR